MSMWRLAWRNVWRNPRRTGLMIAATVFAVFLVVFFVAMTNGVHQKMIEDTVRLHSGHVTISAPGYTENRTLDYFLRLDTTLIHTLDTLPEVQGWAPRVTSFALVSKEVESRGVALLGVDPRREPTVTTLARRVRTGRFLTVGGDHEIVLGTRLAKRLGARLGDRLLVYGVAYSLESAYDLYTLVGTITLPNAALERGLALLSLRNAQDFLVYGNRISEVAVLARSADRTDALRSALRKALANGVGGRPLAIRTWREMMPDLDQLLTLDSGSLAMMVVILVVVVGFGILNTILMAVLERTRELGVMLAVGLHPGKVFRMVFIESFALAAIGLVIGLGLAIPVCLYFEAHPIDLSGQVAGAYEFFGLEPLLVFNLGVENVLYSSLTTIAVALLAGFYPALKASHGDPVTALRSL